jgi:hypothetical protein
MSNSQIFTYSEGLTARGQLRVPEPLIVDDQASEQAIMLRLFSGSLKVRHEYSESEFSQRFNYFSSDRRSFGQTWASKFPRLVSPETSAQDIADYIQFSRYANKAFYKSVLIELAHFLYMKNRKSHTSAFIYLYRLLEKISYAFPMIYASKTTDFMKTFSTLKDLMGGDSGKGELGFFQKFVEELYREDPIAETSVDIALAVGDENAQRNMYNELFKICPNDFIHEDTESPSKLSINYCHMGSFIITLRNRFFHNLSGGLKNIKSSNVVDSDLLFEQVNDEAMSWVANTYLMIFTYGLAEFQRMRK